MVDAPFPPNWLVAHLRAFDPELRLRWGRHQEKWLIELRAKEQQPAWLKEKPSAVGTTPRALDWWDAWRDGYVYVTALAHPIAYPWEFIAAHLTHLSLEAHKGKDALLDRLDAAEAEDEARTRREWSTVNEAGAKELYDALAWDQGRRVSLYDPPAVVGEERDGFRVLDRRVVRA